MTISHLRPYAETKRAKSKMPYLSAVNKHNGHEIIAKYQPYINPVNGNTHYCWVDVWTKQPLCS